MNRFYSFISLNLPPLLFFIPLLVYVIHNAITEFQGGLPPKAVAPYLAVAGGVKIHHIGGIKVHQ